MTKEIVSLECKPISWSAKQIVKMMDNKTARFDSFIQRSLVWDVPRKSLLIHSMITGAPIPSLYACKAENKTYSFLDGKQRCNAIWSYVKGQYTLQDVPEIMYTDGSSEDINGRYFSGLTEDMQDAILSYIITVKFFEDLTDEQISEIFFRINNGKAMSAIEAARARCKALTQVQVITKHPVFDFLSEKARARYTDEDIVIKSMAMLEMDEPCLDTKAIRPFMENLDVNKAKRSKMFDIFTNIQKMHDEMIENEAGTPAKRLYVKTHFLSIIPFVAEHGKQTEFLQHFFSGERMTISKKYNDNATAGVGHAPSVKARMEAIEAEWKRFKK